MGALRSVLTLSPGKLTAGYLSVGVGWLFLTDLVAAGLVASPRLVAGVETAGVWLLLAGSGLVVFGLSQHHRRRIEENQSRLRTANQQLQVLHRVFRHNVRNDLNVIEGYATVVAEEREGERTRSLETIRRTAHRLVALCEKLKVVHRVDPASTGERRVDLVGVLETELERLRSAHPSVTVETSTPGNVEIDGDASFAFALREVLENAVVHHDAPEECTLGVDVSREGEAVVLEVTDDGPGIPPEELEALRRGEETQLAHASSIGLWTVTWVCRLHGGTVGFSSEPGEGTSVRLRFRDGSGDADFPGATETLGWVLGVPRTAVNALTATVTGTDRNG